MLDQHNNTVAVAMSGGVDSSAVAAMLHAEGYDLIGLTLQLWNQRRLAGAEGIPGGAGGHALPTQGRCCSIDDVYDARRVAERLGIPYYLVNEQARFERDVVQPFVNEYLAGRTPIPCSLCNNHLKFDQLLTTARQIGADRIATGHYARNVYDPVRGRWILKRPADRSKDQTYFLFGLTQEQLGRTLFPLGSYQKPAVRAIAAEAGLALAQKPDSQEICFIPGGDYKRFIDAYLDEQGRELPDTAGELVSTSGELLGEHAGIHNFTVGQRKGLGLASSSPLYVIQIDGAANAVTVGREDELLRDRFLAKDLNWIGVDTLPGPEAGAEARPVSEAAGGTLREAAGKTVRVLAKIRHRHEPAPATLRMVDAERVEVVFDTPQRAVTPGQSAVFYQGDEVLGGGWIE